jgi:hypothetical protein
MPARTRRGLGGRTPTSLLAVLDQPARALAGAIAPQLTGASASGVHPRDGGG